MMEEIKPKKERKFLKAMGDIALTLFRVLVLGIGKKVINKVGNKRQGLVIAFLLVAGISYASIDSIPYPVTGNKQRLGWQTSGNGLVYRGRSNDTITKPSSYVDKNVKAYLLLDSVRGTIFVWRQTYWDSILVGGGGGTFAQPIDSLFFNTGVPTNNVDTAKMRWDSDLATVVLGLNDNVPNELGFKNFWLVKNQTGSTITKGSLVYANGTVGASGRITVAKFIANGSIDAKYLLGITAHDLTDGEDGYVISFGKIRQVNTDTFAAGAILYPSPTVAGVWTDVEPVAPNIDMPIGFCINSSVNNGTIAIRVASGYKLSELHDVAISSPIEKSSLYYSGGLWRDTTAALLVSDTASMLLPYLRDADTVTLSNRINLKLNIADTSAFARDNQISGTSGQVAYFNSSNSVISDAGLIYNATNKSLGINTTTTSGANLIIKNSQEPVRSTVVATQTFAADTTNWTRGAGWTFNGTQAVATAATGDLTYTPALTITSGNAYEITYTLSNYTAGTLTARFGNATALTLPTHNVTNNIVVLLPTAATGGFRFNTSTFTGNLDNVSVVQIANPSPILFAGQDDNSTTLYNALRMPNSSTITFGNTAGIYTTGLDNVFIGRATANNNTTGNSNVFIGSEIGNRNTSGSNNVFIGKNIGTNNTTGGGNNFIGTDNGVNNTTGSYNNFFGINVGLQNTTGTNNSFFGASSGRDNTTGNSNTFFGFQSGLNNTVGINNSFIGYIAGKSNTTGSFNAFFGVQAGENSLSGSRNVFIGIESGKNNTSGSANVFIGREAGLNNRAGLDNVSIGTFTGRNIKGNYNVSLGYGAGDNGVIADTTTGSNNILIGFASANNIAAAAAGNVAIGNAVDLPTNNGSNQGVYQNVLFFTGASGTGTTIAAASKAGIKTNAPNRDLEVAGEVRITDLTTDAPTRLVGADADGDLGQVTLGAGLSLASSSLLADTSFLVTRFDTASMLTPYFRDADTSTLNLISRFAEKQNILVSGNNIKTVNSNNLLGSGNVSVGTVTNVTIASSTPMSITNSTTTPEISMPAASASVSGYLQATAFSLFQSKQGTISLTTTGSSGVSTFDGSTLNIPNYTLSGLGGVPTSRTITINGTSQDLSTNRTFNVGTLIGTDTVSLSNRINLKFNTADTSLLNLTSRFAAKLNLSDTLNMLVPYLRKADTTNMLLPYFRDADTTSLNLTSRFNTKLNLSDTASMLTNYLRTGTAASTYLTQSNAASTYLPLTGGTLSGLLKNTSQRLTGNITISDFDANFSSVQIAPSSSATVNLAIQQNITGAANISMGGNQGGGGEPFNPNIYFTDNRKAYASIGGIHTSGGTNNQSGHIVFNTTPSVNSVPLTERMRIAQDGAITMGGTLGVTGATTLSAPLTVNSSAVFNEGAADADFRVESVGNAHMVFVDASTNRVGIGYASPTKTLDVNGEVRINTVTATPTSLLGKDGSNVVGNVTLGNSLTLSSGTLSVNNKITDINTSSYTILSTDYYIDNFNSSSTTITLPTASSNTYREIKFKNSSTGALTSNVNIIPLSGSGTTTTILSATNAKWCTLVSDGAYWRIMQSN